MSDNVEPLINFEENDFLGAIMRRWNFSPDHLFGVFHDGDDWKPITTASFMTDATRFSGLFVDAGVMTGDVVLIILKHGVEPHAAFIGAMLIGASPAFMPSPNVKQDAELYWSQHRLVFAHIKPRAILTYDALVPAITEAAQGTGAAIIPASGATARVPAPITRLPPAAAVALLQHSSGTTGLKKGVKLSYQAIIDQLKAYREALDLDSCPHPCFASWLPLYHDMGLISSFLLPIWLGVPIISIDPFEWTRNPSLLLDAIQDYQATHTWVPNFALLHQVRTARSGRSWQLGSLKAIICCSEPNKPEAFDVFTKRFADCGITPSTLQTCYAMAETVFAVTQSRLGHPVRRLAVDRAALQTHGRVEQPDDAGAAMFLLSNGRPITGCEVRVYKDDAFVNERMVGEICIKSGFLFSGYHNNPIATSGAFLGEWLRTGDLGFLDNGEVFIVGRLKDIIIVNGKNIVAHDVEAAVAKVPFIKPGRAVAFGHYVESAGSECLVVVAERLEDDVDASAAIRAISRAVVEEVGVSCGDVRLVNQGWLVKTTSGKISRSENARKYAAGLLD